MLLVRGMNVYPREIEEVLHQFPNVREAAVVSKADEKRGEVPIAFVSPANGATLDPNEILRFCRDRLADYKIPREIRVVDALPRTATGKIAKVELKKTYRVSALPLSREKTLEKYAFTPRPGSLSWPWAAASPSLATL